MIAAVLLMTVIAQAPAPTCPTAPSPMSLDQAMARILTAVRIGNASALLAQMSHDGVAFGSHGGVVPYTALADQFVVKRGHYCDLFACGGRTGRLNALFTGGKTQKTFDLKHSRATIVLNGNGPRELDLGYAYTAQCQWQLTSIGAF